MDFTISKYRGLCEAIADTEYRTYTMSEYFLNKDKVRHFILLRHDIDRMPHNALNMAKVETENGIKATYYFRMTKEVFNQQIIKMIENQGHEIGFHYEDLSRTNGNYEKAIRLFETEIKEFRKICDVKTICMHGSPLSRYDNRDLWKKYDYTAYNIIGEAYLSVDNNLNYYSDTGRTWNTQNKIRDFIPNGKSRDNIKSTDDVINLIKSSNYDNMYLLSHPERWANSSIEWIASLSKDCLINIGKKFLAIVR